MKRKHPKLTIGRRDKIDFPELRLKNIDAKIDTGAYTSSIHCSKIEVVCKDGEERIRFSLFDPIHPSHNKMITLPIYAKSKIKNSFGQVEERYIIKTKVKLFSRVFDLEVSLTDRSKMEYPVLLGRKLLHNHFVVDVTKTDLSYKQKSRMVTK